MSIRPATKQAPAAVYRHFNAAGEILYIGMTANPEERERCHSFCSRWFADVERIELEWFPTRAEAFAAERRAIRAETPPFNQTWGKQWDSIKSFPAALLLAWMEETDTTAKDIAAKGGFSASCVNDIIYCDARPTPRIAAKIEAGTDGAIPADLWVKKPSGRKSRQIRSVSIVTLPGVNPRSPTGQTAFRAAPAVAQGGAV
jgi:predicted GIY-YIG superfamily endonuclease